MERSGGGDARAWRAIAVVGVLVSLGGIGGMFLPALDPPSSQATSAEFADYYRDERTSLLVLAYLNGVAMAAIAAVFLALRDALRRWGATWASLGLLGGVLTLALTLAGFSVLGALAYRGGDVEAARQLTDVGWILIDLAAGPPTTLSIAAFTVAIARSPAARPWIVGAGVVVAAAHLVVAGAFAREGFMAPAGTVAHVVPCLWFAWVIVACVVLLRLARDAERPAPAR